MLDGEILGKELTEIVRGFVERANKPLLDRIDALERNMPQVKDGRDGERGERGEKGEIGTSGKDGRDGAPGRSITKLLTDAKGHLLVTYSDGAVDDVGLIVGAKGADGKDGLNGKDGAAGIDGKSVDMAQIEAMVSEGIAKAVGSLPKAKDGRDGADGKDGADGLPGAKGEPGMNGQDGKPGEKGEPGADGKDGANGRDGVDGKDGRDGSPGEKGLDGRDGKDGADGVGMADAVIDRDGNLVLTMTDGRHKALGLIVGKNGIDGKNGADGLPGKDGPAGRDGSDGKDGLGFDDMSVAYDGERTVTVRFEKGDRIKEFPLVMPIVIDRGVWQERGLDGAGYKQGDGVTWGGSFYIARKDTFAKPDDFEAWRLSVKRGKDAKEPVKL